MAKNSVSILFVGDGFPVPLHSSLFTASPNPLGRFSCLLREANASPTPLQIGDLQRKVRPRTTLSFRTSAHSGVGISIKFRAVYRHTDHSFAPFSGIHPGEVVLLSGGLPRQCAHWLAMTGNSANSILSVFRVKPWRFPRKGFSALSGPACRWGYRAWHPAGGPHWGSYIWEASP